MFQSRKILLLLACSLVGFSTAQQSLQIIGIQEDDCGLSPNYYQTKPTLTVCMAESAPFLVRRQLYVPTTTSTSCADDSEENSEDGDEAYQQYYDNIEALLQQSPTTGAPLTADDFHKLYTGYDADLLLAVLSSGIFSDYEYEVKLFSTPSAAMYGLRMEQCDFALSGLVHVGSVITEEMCANVTNQENGGLDFHGTCPTVSGTTVPTLGNACCLEYSTWYKRFGPAVLSKQKARQSQAGLFFVNISKPDPIKILCSVVLSLLLSGHLVWYFERRSNSIQFPEDYGTGVDHGLWWSVVTMATVGYGDKAPVTLMGRLLGVAWMFIGIMMLGYFSGVMVEGYVDPPARFDAFATWLDVSEHFQSTGSQFCTADDTFFRTTLVQQGLASEDGSSDKTAILFTDTMDQCYTMLLQNKVAGVVANKPHLLFDAVKSAHNPQHPLSKCDDMVVSPVIEPVYHSLAVRKSGTHPADFNKNLKCSLDGAIREFEDGATLFSRPDLPYGPSYTSQDAHLAWFRDYENGEVALLGANEIDSSNATEAYALLCATILAYAIMLVALWVTRYRRARILKMAMRSKDGDEPTLVPKSRMARFTTDFAGDDDDIQHLTADPGGMQDYEEMEKGDLPAGPVNRQAMRLNEDRLITICEQLSDLRLMIKRLENQQAGIQMPRAKPKKNQAGKSYREIDQPNAPDQ